MKLDFANTNKLILNNMNTKPCIECPFKKDSFKGYLGGFSVAETLDCANSEQSFKCHLTRETDNESECVGRMLYANKTCKSFRNPYLEKLRFSVKNESTENILGFDFREHHKDSY